MTWAIIN